MEERVVTELVQRKQAEVNATVQQHLAGVRDHVNFTMQQAYFKCAYDCFDRCRTQEGIKSCVENCIVPVRTANNVVENEMAKFEERLNWSLMVCHDKFKAARLQKMKTDATQVLESCVSRSIDDSIRVLPHVVEHINSTLKIN